jgi:hypothetical protein
MLQPRLPAVWEVTAIVLLALAVLAAMWWVNG